MAQRMGNPSLVVPGALQPLDGGVDRDVRPGTVSPRQRAPVQRVMNHLAQGVSATLLGRPPIGGACSVAQRLDRGPQGGARLRVEESV